MFESKFDCLDINDVTELAQKRKIIKWHPILDKSGNIIFCVEYEE